MVTTILMSIWGVLGLLLALLGLIQRPLRARVWPGALAAAGAAMSARSDSFWPMTVLGLFALWLACLSVPVGDVSWRARFGFVKVKVEVVGGSECR